MYNPVTTFPKIKTKKLNTTKDKVEKKIVRIKFKKKSKNVTCLFNNFKGDT